MSEKLTFRKKANPADIRRKKIYTPTECLVPKIENGFVIVHPEKRSSVRALEQKGFRLFKHNAEIKKEVKNVGPKPNAPKRVKEKSENALLTKEALKDLNVKELLNIAKSLKIIGRHKMKEDELIKAIMIARSESK